MKFSILIPVYGSEKILKSGYEAFSREIAKITDEYEILYRVDGTPDDSERILREIAKEDDRVRVFAHSPNRGLGYTLRKLFEDARGEYVIYFDADSFLCFDLEFLPTVTGKAREADAVIVSRYMFNPHLPFHRYVASEAYYLVNRLLFGIQIRDIGSGFVVFRKAALDSLDLSSDGFEIHAEIFVRMADKGYKVLEIPLAYKHWEGGSFRFLTHGVKALIDTFKLRRQIKK